jgi:regulator of replication initiation timing
MSVSNFNNHIASLNAQIQDLQQNVKISIDQISFLSTAKAKFQEQVKDLTAEVTDLTAEKASLATTNSRLKAALVTVALVAGGVIAVVKNPGAVNSTLDSLKALIKR